jgi:hypothetical protein
MIAQVPLEWSQIGIWLGCLAAVMLMLKLGLDIWKDHFRTPDPVPPLHDRYATKREHQELAGRVDSHIHRTDERFAHMSDSGSKSREKIYESLRKLEQNTARLEERTESQNSRMVNMDAKIDRILSQSLKQ